MDAFQRARQHFEQNEDKDKDKDPFSDSNMIKPDLPPRPQPMSSALSSQESIVQEKPPLPQRPNVLPQKSKPLIITGAEDANRDPPVHADPKFTEVVTNAIAVSRGSVVVRSTGSTFHTYKDGNITVSSNYEPRQVTALSFAPSRSLPDDGRFLWIGLSDGELQVYDNGILVERRITAHSYSISFVLPCHADCSMLTIDENGVLQHWTLPNPATQQLFNVPSLSNAATSKKTLPDSVVSLESAPNTHRVGSKQTTVLCVGQQLWTAKERWIEVMLIKQGTHLKRMEAPVNVGFILCMTAAMNMIYTGHQDGKLCEWDKSFNKLRILDLGAYRVSSIAGINDSLWLGFGTGRICILSGQALTLTKEWTVNSSVDYMVADVGSLVHGVNSLLVTTASQKGHVWVWDALLPKDYFTHELKSVESSFCTYDTVTLHVCSWNIDAQKPDALEVRGEDAYFMDRWVQSSVKEGASIFVFGLQEIVDLESTGVAARGIFNFSGASSQNINTNEREQIHKNRAILWKDRLIKALRANFKSPYKVVESRNLVGLYTLVMCKESLLISAVSSNLVSTGLNNTYGNKGAVVVRLCVNDTSICLINSHLPAHQTKVSKRNVDAITILRSGGLSPLDSKLVRFGDGTHILDHEVVLFSGDLNYRIDLDRDKVISCVEAKDYPQLWMNDQLVKQRTGTGGGILRIFQEGQLDFAPTYKYDRNSNIYDTGEKKRVPAYCDRILYRGADLKHYGRLECQVSDHRPIVGHFDVKVKTIDHAQWQAAESQASQKYQQHVERLRLQDKINWLMSQNQATPQSKVEEVLSKFNGDVDAANSSL